jgi:ATP-binding cassette subfamily F protein 3
MAFIILKDIELAYGARKLLDKVSLTLDSKSRTALAGINGAGKSTLLKILAGRLQPDDGELTFSKNCRISYMAQSSPLDTALSLFATADSAFERFYDIEHEIAELDRRADEEALQKRSLLQEELNHSDFYKREGLIDATLSGLGFKRADFKKQMEAFSSGWRMRALLAKVLLENADILVLDEPSNYLDIESTAFLTGWLRRFEGGVILVSHDRRFLDTVTTETLELFNGRLKRYAFNYSAYEKRREEEIRELTAKRQRQEERIKQIEEYVRRFGSKSSKAAQAQSRLKELEKIELVEIPEDAKKIHIDFPAPPPSGERVFYAENLKKSYGPKKVFENLTLLIAKGEKVIVTGPNGAGKSTFLRIAAGYDKNFEGYMKYGSGVSVGYFSEETHEPFTGKTVVEEVEANAPVAMQPQLRSLLAAFLFREDDINKPIAGLSGGEKARLLLLRLFLKPFNLLILDEPTNHLDLQAKDALLAALQRYKGTLIFVSHDRYFLENLGDYTLAVDVKPKY